MTCLPLKIISYWLTIFKIEDRKGSLSIRYLEFPIDYLQFLIRIKELPLRIKIPVGFEQIKTPIGLPIGKLHI